jgi:hypothetical protein
MKRLLTLPTRAQLKRDIWRPDDSRLVVRKAWGWGFTIDFARLFRRPDGS